MFKNRKRKGFTLIELVIVIAIIGILAAIAIPRFANSTEKAQNTKIEANARTLASAVSSNYAENQKWVNVNTADDVKKIVENAGLDSAKYTIKKASAADGIIIEVKEDYTGKAKNAYNKLACAEGDLCTGENTNPVYFKY